MSDETIENLGDWVRVYRKQRGWTQEELRMAAKISKGYVSAIERNAPHSLTGKESTPKAAVLDRIAAALAPSPRLIRQYQNEARDLAGLARISDKRPAFVVEDFTTGDYTTGYTDGTVTKNDIQTILTELTQAERIIQTARAILQKLSPELEKT